MDVKKAILSVSILSRSFFILLVLLFAQFSLLHAQDDATELQRQQERERELRQRLAPQPDIRLDAPAPLDMPHQLPTETPCFVIDRITLDGERSEYFDWALHAANPPDDPAIGQCLGTQGIAITLNRVQNALLKRGYITTRVLLQPQDIRRGTLTLTLIPGRVSTIRQADESQPTLPLQKAFPRRKHALLNLRDIEQAMENLKRPPGADADIQIHPASHPGAHPGESDLVVDWRQERRIRFGATLDDSGSKATGKLQGGLTFAWDNPLWHNDLFYLSLQHDLGGGSEGSRGNKGYSIHYSLPFAWWALGLTTGVHDYHQEVQGSTQNYVYSGKSQNSELRLERLLYRDRSRKTGIALAGWLRTSSNYLDDTEIQLQRRRMAGWLFGLNHLEYLGRSTLSANLNYRRGTGAMGAIAAPEELSGEGTARPIILRADARLEHPFTLGGRPLRYSAQWRAQWHHTPLIPQDRFAIGGRYTVRGFSGERVLSGERGWLLRNDLTTPLGNTGQQLYLGIDYGEISGPSRQYQGGDHLAGAVLGMRGGKAEVHYHVFIGVPLDKPGGFESSAVTGFQLSFQP